MQKCGRKNLLKAFIIVVALSKLGIKDIVGFMKHQTVKTKHSILGVAY